MTITKKRRWIAVFISVLAAIVLCIIGIFSTPKSLSLAHGEVFDYSKAEETVRYKSYQSDPADPSARKGLLLYAYDSGASVPFKASFNGNFSAELTSAANEDGAVELTKYSLLFHDVATGAEFSVVIKNKPSQKDVSVSYNGVRAGIHYHEQYSYRMLGLTGEFNAADEYTFFSSHAARITFDPKMMEVKLRSDDGVDRTVWNFSNLYNDGKKLDHDLPTFGEYTVSVVFDEINKNSRGDIIIYSFGSCYFDTVSPDFQPNLSANLAVKGVLGHEYVLPTASIVDVMEGSLDATAITVEVYDADGNKVNDGNAFTPTSEGTYYIYYSYDKEGKKATAYYAIEAIAEEKAQTAYYFEEPLNKAVTVGKNTKTYLPKAAVESALFLSTTPVNARISIYKDGALVDGYESVASGFTYSFTEIGEYQIVYSTPMLSGQWAKTETFDVTVTDEALGVVLSNEVPQTLALNESLTLPTAKMYIHGEELNPSATIVYPSGMEKTDETVLLDEVGVYTLYYVSGENEYSKTFAVKETYADLFTDVDGDKGVFEEVVANNETTGVKISLRENTKFSYEKIIDLSDNTFDDTLVDRSKNTRLIEMFAQPHKIDTSDVDALYITLTDVHNPNNYIEIRMKYLSYSPQGVYIRTRAAGQANWVGYNYDFYSTNLTVHDAGAHEEGGFFSYLSTTHNFHDFFENLSLKLYFDNETKCLYGDPAWKYGHTNSGEDKSLITPWLIRDFKTTDAELSAGNKPWGGFTTGEVYLSVYAKGVNDTADFYVTEIDGVSLKNEFIEPSAPTITIDMQNNATAAYALVGKPYKLLDYNASNGDIAIVDEAVEVRRIENGVLTSPIRVKDGAFTPVAAVTYAIVYKVTNAYGITTEKRVIVEAKSALETPTLNVDMTTLPQTAVYGQEILLPKAFGYGGAGWVNVVYKVINNGEEVPVENGKFVCFDTGDFDITVTATDYIGQVTKLSHTVAGVTVSGEPVVNESTLILPSAFIVGDTFTFANYEAIVYGEDFSVQTLSAKIEVVDGNGVKVIGADGKYNPSAGAETDAAMVKFIFGTGANALTVERTIPVLNIKNGPKFLTNYFVAKNAEKDADAHNVYFTAQDTGKDMSFSFIRGVDSTNFSLKLNFVKEYVAYASVTVLLQDIYDKDATAEILLTKSGGKTYASLNGGENKEVYVEKDVLQIRYSAKTKEFTDALGVVFASFEKGFTNNSVYITVTANGVYGESQIGVQNINNQTINLINRDLQKPNITLAEEFEGRYAAGKEVLIPAASTYDVLNDVSDVTVTIEKEDGEVYVEKQVANKPISFTPEKFGYYIVTYTARDNAGNQQTIRKTFSVYDAGRPSITFKSQIPNSVSVGTTLKLPSYSLADNASLNDLIVRIYFATPDGMMTTVTNSGSVTFAVKGYYSINYLVMDKNNNIATYTFSVKAE